MLTVESTADLSEGMFVNRTGIAASTRVAQILSATTLLLDQDAVSTGINRITFFSSDVISGSITGTGSFTKTGVGELRVTGSFSQSGAFTVSNGPVSTITTQPESSLLIGSSTRPGNVLSDSARPSSLGRPELHKASISSKMLQLRAGFERIGGLSGGNSNTTINLLNLASVTVLAVGGNNANTTWNGVLAGENIGTFVLKEGAGKLTVTNAQTNNGVWHVDNGVLEVAGAGAIDDPSLVWVGNRTGAGFEIDVPDTIAGLIGGGHGASRDFGLNGAPIGFITGNFIGGTGGNTVLNSTLTMNNDVAANVYSYGGVYRVRAGSPRSTVARWSFWGPTRRGHHPSRPLPWTTHQRFATWSLWWSGWGGSSPGRADRAALSPSTTVIMLSAAAGTPETRAGILCSMSMVLI